MHYLTEGKRRVPHDIFSYQADNSASKNVHVGLLVSGFIGLAIEIYTAWKSCKNLETYGDVPS